MVAEQLVLNMVSDTTLSLSNTRDDLLGARRLFKALSNPDALMIFTMARDGIEADTTTYSKIGLTRKKYYTRLIQLKNAGLIEKKGRLYFQTTMGSFLQENCVNSVIHAIKNRKNMVMIDVLRRNGNMPEEELLQMKNALCKVSLGGTD